MDKIGILKRKCPVCKSCMVHYLHENTIYFACGLCMALYKLIPKGRVEQVTNENLIKKVEFRLT